MRSLSSDLASLQAAHPTLAVAGNKVKQSNIRLIYESLGLYCPPYATLQAKIYLFLGCNESEESEGGKLGSKWGSSVNTETGFPRSWPVAAQLEEGRTAENEVNCSIYQLWEKKLEELDLKVGQLENVCHNRIGKNEQDILKTSQELSDLLDQQMAMNNKIQNIISRMEMSREEANKDQGIRNWTGNGSETSELELKHIRHH